jgi:hypothetical protein
VISGIFSREFKTGDLNLVIHSMIDPGVLCGTEESNTLQLSGDIRYSAASISENIYNILVYHGKVTQLEQILIRYQWIDLVLLAHDQYKGKSEIDGRMVIGVGRDGESVAVINIQRQGGLISAQVNHREINTNLPADEKIGIIIREYKTAIQAQAIHD